MGEDSVPWRRVLLVGAIMLVSFNFRLAITSLSPLLDTVHRDLGLSYGVIGLLATIPTVCFGVCAFAASPLARRHGRETTIFWALVLIGVGTLLRFWSGYAAVLFASTFLVGAGIAVGQALLPAIISDSFSERAALVTGLYTASLIVGAAVASGTTVAIQHRLGSWSAALGTWAVPALLAAAVWYPHAWRRSTRGSSATPQGVALPLRNPAALGLALFFGAQALMFYTTVTWLSPRYVDLGWSPGQTGVLLTVFFVVQLGGALGLAPLSDCFSDRRPVLALVLTLMGVGYAGIGYAPLARPWVWTVLLGIGIGGIFSLVLTLPVDFTSNPDTAGQLTTVMVGVGYLVASLGPLLGGVAREEFGSYTVLFGCLALMDITLLAATVFLRGDRQIL